MPSRNTRHHRVRATTDPVTDLGRLLEATCTSIGFPIDVSALDLPAAVEHGALARWVHATSELLLHRYVHALVARALHEHQLAPADTFGAGHRLRILIDAEHGVRSETHRCEARLAAVCKELRDAGLTRPAPSTPDPHHDPTGGDQP